MDTQLFVFFEFSSPLELKDSKIQAKYLPRSGYYALGLYKVGGSHCCLLREMRILRALHPPTSSRRGHLHLPYNLASSCQFCFVLFKIIKTFHTNSKNKIKRNKFHFILNLGPFRIFRLNSTRNVPVSFHMFRSALEKPLNQIEPCSI
jgi:hypothetical protein